MLIGELDQNKKEKLQKYLETLNFYEDYVGIYDAFEKALQKYLGTLNPYEDYVGIYDAFEKALQNYYEDKCGLETIEFIYDEHNCILKNCNIYETICFFFSKNDLKDKYKKADFLFNKYCTMIDETLFEVLFTDNEYNNYKALSFNQEDLEYLIGKIKPGELLGFSKMIIRNQSFSPIFKNEYLKALLNNRKVTLLDLIEA